MADCDGAVNGVGNRGALDIFPDDDGLQNNRSNLSIGFNRMDGDWDVTTFGSAIYASFGYQALRASEIRVSLTPVPEWGTMIALVSGGFFIKTSKRKLTRV